MNRLWLFAFLALSLVAVSCGPDQRIINSAKEREAEREEHIANANVARPANSFEADVDAMRTADFKFILVFRRKDDQPMDAADKALISRNTGMQANRRTLSDGGKAVIIAGNFPFATDLMKELTTKFKMENHSKPDAGPFVSDAVQGR